MYCTPTIIADSTNGAVDITFDNISIDTAKDDAIELNGNNQVTFHFTGRNTLKAGVAGVATNSTPLKITSEDNGELIISGVKCGIGTAGSKPGKPLEIGGNIRITIPEGVEDAIYNNINSVTFSGNPVIDADVAEYAVYGVGLEFLGGTFTIKNDSGSAILSGDGGGIYKDIIIKGNTDIHITEAKTGIHNKNADIIIGDNAKVKMYGGDGETKTACVGSSGISCQDGDVNISGDALVDVFVEEDGIYSGAAIEIKDRAKVYIKCAYEGSSTQYAVHFDTTLDIKDNAVVDIESTTDKKVNGFDQSSGTVNISGNAAVNIDGANRGVYTKVLNISDSASLTVENSLDYALYKDVTVKPESGKAYMVKTGSSEETADTEYYTSEETIKRKSYWTYFHASPSAGIPVTITGTDQTITFDESPYDVSQMFVIDENAGEATYSIVDETGTDTGAGTLSGANLTVTKAVK